MNVHQELHAIVDALDGSTAKQQLHTVLDDLNEEQARETLTRLRDLHRRSLDNLGFIT